MYFSIDTAADVPIYEQIVRQVKLAVADGTLAGGQMLPSVRQLAREIALNPNTIARAYRDLQTQNVVEPLRGRGLVVRRDAIAACTQSRNDWVLEALRAALSDALAGGLSADELRQLFERELADLQRQSNHRPPSNSPDSSSTR